MFKKILIGVVVVVGLIYGTGNDLESVKNMAIGKSNANAHSLTGTDNGGWGS